MTEQSYDLEIHRKIDRMEPELDEVKRLILRLRNELRALKISSEKQSRRSVRALVSDDDIRDIDDRARRRRVLRISQRG